MKQFELEESLDIIKHINGLLLLFSATPKTNQLLREYLAQLIEEIKDQELPDEVAADEDAKASFDKQIEFLENLLVTLEDLNHSAPQIGKELN